MCQGEIRNASDLTVKYTWKYYLEKCIVPTRNRWVTLCFFYVGSWGLIEIVSCCSWIDYELERTIFLIFVRWDKRERISSHVCDNASIQKLTKEGSKEGHTQFNNWSNQKSNNKEKSKHWDHGDKCKTYKKVIMIICKYSIFYLSLKFFFFPLKENFIYPSFKIWAVWIYELKFNPKFCINLFRKNQLLFSLGHYSAIIRNGRGEQWHKPCI